MPISYLALLNGERRAERERELQSGVWNHDMVNSRMSRRGMFLIIA